MPDPESFDEEGSPLAAMSGGFAREISSLEGVFALLADFLGGQRLDERSTFCINLVAEELFTNMVRHNRGGGENIGLRVERQGNRIELELIDTDVDSFDPADVGDARVTAGIGERRPGGLGLHIVRAMVDRLDYDYDDEKREMRISVTKVVEH